MEFLAFGAFLAVIVVLLAIGINSTRKTDYVPKEHNPRYTQNGWIDASKNWKG